MKDLSMLTSNICLALSPAAGSIEVAIERDFGPTNLTITQTFRIRAPTEIVMVGEHENDMLAAL